MSIARGTEALVDLENRAPDVLFENAPGSDTPLWPYMRIPLANVTREREFATKGHGPILSTRRIASFLGDTLRNGRRSPLRARNARCLFYTVGTTVFATPGGQRNWLVDAYAHALQGDAVVVQKAPFRHVARFGGRPDFPATFTFDRVLARAEVSARLQPLRGDAARAVRRTVNAILDEFDFPLTDAERARIEFEVAHQRARTRVIEPAFRRLLDRVRPELLVMDGAAYGNMAGQIALAKSRGIVVVEPQHGWIGNSHPAYNFGAAMADERLFRVMPDVIITFGDFWSEQIRVPSGVIAVGKPYLESKTRQARPLAERPKRLLVASSMTDTEEMSDFVVALRAAMPQDWTVAFRPHPTERPEVESRYPRLASLSGVEFDRLTDVYESLTESRAVVGVASTVLFEAVAFGCATFVKDSVFADLYGHAALGERIAGPADVGRIAESLTRIGGAMPDAATMRSLWKPDAVDTFVRLAEAWSDTSRGHLPPSPEAGTRGV